MQADAKFAASVKIEPATSGWGEIEKSWKRSRCDCQTFQPNFACKCFSSPGMQMSLAEPHERCARTSFRKQYVALYKDSQLLTLKSALSYIDASATPLSGAQDEVHHHLLAGKFFDARSSPATVSCTNHHICPAVLVRPNLT